MSDKSFYENYIKAFLEENSKVNLISKNDEKFLWEKHISDSLAIKAVFEKFGYPKEILDIGTGGGFPSVPIAITYSDIEVFAIDSIAKKIKAIENIKEKLNIKNLTTICSRVENYDKSFEMITTRAVSRLKTICEYALPKLKQNGYFIAYKSKKYEEEISESKNILKKYHSKIIEIIDYKLPLEDDIIRKLIVIKKEI